MGAVRGDGGAEFFLDDVVVARYDFLFFACRDQTLGFCEDGGT